MKKNRERANFSCSLQTIVVSSALSVALITFLNFFGTFDIEESTKQVYSAGLSYSSGSWFANARETGTASSYGVPVFDAMQGTGQRLPLQASWAQSPEWPFRFLFGWRHYVLFKVFLITVASLHLAIQSSKSWDRKPTMVRSLILGLMLLAPAGVYMRWNEWTDTYAQVAASFAIVAFLLKRPHFHDLTRDTAGVLPPTSDTLMLAFCFTTLCAGHPGVLPYSLYVIVATILVGLMLSHHFRRRIVTTLRSQFFGVALVIGPGVLVMSVMFVDLMRLTNEDEFAKRSVQSHSFYAASWINQLSNELMPESVGKYLALAISTVVLPGLIVLLKLLPNSALQDSFAMVIPRGEFAGFLIFVVGIIIRFRRQLPISHKNYLEVALAVQAFAVLFAVMSEIDLLPKYLSGSGSFLMFSILLQLSTLMAFNLTGGHFQLGFVFQNLVRMSLVLTSIWTMLVFGFFVNSQEIVPKRASESSWYPSTAEALDLAPILSKPSRAVFLDSQRRWIALPVLGKPLVFPSTPKIRDSQHLVEHYPLDASIGVEVVRTEDVEYLSKVLDFLSVEQVIFLKGEQRLLELVQRLSELESSRNRLSSAVVFGSEYLIWERTQFSSFLLKHGELSQEKCPILQQECALLLQANRILSTDGKAIEVCKAKCLWEMHTSELPPRMLQVFPITFDGTLRVIREDGQEVPTFDIGGFLAVSTNDLSFRRLQIFLEPDLIMRTRIISSYLSTLSLICIIILTIRCYFARPMLSSTE